MVALLLLGRWRGFVWAWVDVVRRGGMNCDFLTPAGSYITSPEDWTSVSDPSGVAYLFGCFGFGALEIRPFPD